MFHLPHPDQVKKYLSGAVRKTSLCINRTCLKVVPAKLSTYRHSLSTRSNNSNNNDAHSSCAYSENSSLMLETRPSYNSTAASKRSTLDSHSSALPSTAHQRHTLSDVSMYDASKGAAPPTQHSTFPECEGWVYKQSGRYKTWNKRWFVLHGTSLFYFKAPKVNKHRGFIVCPQCNSCLFTLGFENERYHSFARLSCCFARCQ